MSRARYKTPRALEAAVKEASRKSGQDVNRAIADYYHGRFLERVFSEEPPAFTLKGGRSMLARTVSARRTLDTDLLYREADIDKAVEELKRVAAIDLDDFLEFRFVSVNPIAADQEYRDGCNVVFDAVLGGTKTIQRISIDLVVEQVLEGDADIVAPANRLEVAGLPVFDYHLHPVTSAIADKVCATMKPYSNGASSSRVRDLVDIIVYLENNSFDGKALRERIDLESRLRKMDAIGEFRIPDSWRDVRSGAYSKKAREASLEPCLQLVENGEALAKRCIDPAIAGVVDDRSWNPVARCWE